MCFLINKATHACEAIASRARCILLKTAFPLGVTGVTNGDIVRYNPGTDEFGVVSSGGSICTYYKPDPAVHVKSSNLDYFNAR